MTKIATKAELIAEELEERRIDLHSQVSYCAGERVAFEQAAAFVNKMAGDKFVRGFDGEANMLRTIGCELDKLAKEASKRQAEARAELEKLP